MVEFKLLFKEKVTDETAVAPLKKAVDNGNLGPLAVNPASLRIVKEDEGNLRTFSTRNISSSSSSSSSSRISNRGSAGTSTSSDNGSRNIIKCMGSGRRSSISGSSSSGGNRCNSDISAVGVVAALAVVVPRVVTAQWLAMGVESRSSSGSGSGVVLAAARAVTMAVAGVRVVRVPAAPEVTIALA